MFARRCLLRTVEVLGIWWLRERPSKDLEAEVQSLIPFAISMSLSPSLQSQHHLS